ncbi:hypothetical protein EXIGLDRAFT_780761 [Exidia glandulosa HHB12029]|uniref:Uncharacterized protein n=1 Tax=Exidia glandulosa HHB12029 TaxID=1314781 RepID=A0A165BGC0_EXIGL|nr:hypothetical protein EXIGLDRAFT_780761 [Exidia glandulosa HHB12029]
MRRDIDNKLRKELDNKGYILPAYELIDNETAAGVVGSHDRMHRFNAQMAAIHEGLKQSEVPKYRKLQNMAANPAFDVALRIRQNILSVKDENAGVKLEGVPGIPNGFDVSASPSWDTTALSCVVLDQAVRHLV